MGKADVVGALAGMKTATILLDKAMVQLDYTIQEYNKATRDEPVDDENISVQKIAAIAVEDMNIDIAWIHEKLCILREALEDNDKSKAMRFLAR